jgi:hypothetical protein
MVSGRLTQCPLLEVSAAKQFGQGACGLLRLACNDGVLDFHERRPAANLNRQPTAMKLVSMAI